MSARTKVKIEVLNRDGRKVSEAEIDEKTIEAPWSPQVVRSAVLAAHANRRRGTASTKTRGEVRSSGRKPWRQKGTGRARSGRRNSPIWRGGGVTFGPRPRDFSRSVPRKVRRRALLTILADRARTGSLRLVDAVALEETKTRHAAALMKNLKVEGGAVVVVERMDPGLKRAFRNLKEVDLRAAGAISAEGLIRRPVLVMEQKVWEGLLKRLTPAGVTQ